jgi:hypothetical protein
VSECQDVNIVLPFAIPPVSDMKCGPQVSPCADGSASVARGRGCQPRLRVLGGKPVGLHQTRRE